MVDNRQWQIAVISIDLWHVRYHICMDVDFSILTDPRTFKFWFGLTTGTHHWDFGVGMDWLDWDIWGVSGR